MPIEVKELVMRFNVGKQTRCEDEQSKKSGNEKNSEVESIVATCVEQVLDILQRAQER